MKSEEIFRFFNKIKKDLILKKDELFFPYEYCICLSLKKYDGNDMVHYHEYDESKKRILELNGMLVPSLVFFLSQTDNRNMINIVKENLS